MNSYLPTQPKKHQPTPQQVREHQRKEDEKRLWHAYMRIASGKATCTSCTCACKNKRGGRCGMFTPNQAFYDASKKAFDESRRAK